MEKTKLVVFNENVLGYIIPELPNNVLILHSSILKGSRFTDRSHITLDMGVCRLATEQDFDNFRVSFVGFNNPDKYEFNNKH
jgi:hypothetical protein